MIRYIKIVKQNLAKQSKTYKIFLGICAVASCTTFFNISFLTIIILGGWLVRFWGGIYNWGDDL